MKLREGDMRYSWVEEVMNSYVRGDKVKDVWIDAPLSWGSGDAYVGEAEPIEGSSNL